MNVKMNDFCFFCGAPTKIELRSNEDVLEKFVFWRLLFRRSFSLNRKYYKKVGSVVRTVCMYCYHITPKFDIKGREITGEKFRCRSKSLSVYDILSWLDLFRYFRNLNKIPQVY